MLFGIPKLTLVSVSVLYLVASLIGLFNRLRIESSHTPKVDTYGLYVARLLTGALLSGLAGVAGVYLIAQAPTFLGPLSTGPASIPAASTVPVSSALAGASPLPSPASVADATTVMQIAAPKPLIEVFNLTTNQLALLVAAIFGLAPGLLTTRLQAQVSRLESDLARSEPATATGVGDAGDNPNGS
jgi:hypothetical protein